MLPRRCQALFLAASLVPGLTVAGVYKCLDQNRKVFYQDKPCENLTSADLSPELANLAPKENKPQLLWKLTTKGSTFYILGSLPFGTANMYPLPKSVMDAFNSSAGLIIANALDMGETLSRSPEAVRAGFFDDQSVLANHVKPETWQRVQQAAKLLKIPEDKIAAQKPWLAAITLRNAALRQAGYDDKMSIGKSFVKAAEASRPVVEIDSVETQIDRYEKMSPVEQEQILLEAVYEADAASAYFKALADAFMQGDETAVALTERRIQENLTKPEKSMTDRRSQLNDALADKIFEMVSDGRTQFVVIDARLLVGNQGVIAKLEDKGYRSSKL